ncbi:TPA: hypothetical protein ACUL9L_001402, partial [Haemophilus influenzae]
PNKDFPSKRTALEKNLKRFTSEQQYEIIDELCRLPKFSENEKVQDLLIKLVNRYQEFSTETNELPEIALKTKEWLDDYPKAKKHYDDALNKKNNDIYTRNLLDDLRCSLEALVKAILKNSKSLENQKVELGNFFKKHSISVEIRNLYTDKILEFYTKYQNHNVKHNENYNEIEVDFIFEQTAVLMRLLIKLDNKKKTT